MGEILKSVAIVVGCYVAIDQYQKWCKRQEAKTKQEG